MRHAFTLVAVKAKAPLVYAPEAWNAPGVVEKTNCYAYALDEPLLGRPWIGERQYPQFTRDDWFAEPEPNYKVVALSARFACVAEDRAALEEMFFHADGLERIRPHGADPRRDHIIAYAPSLRHVLRREGSGEWTQKKSSEPVCNTDERGHVITNLEAADVRLVRHSQRSVDIQYYRVRRGQSFLWPVAAAA